VAIRLRLLGGVLCAGSLWLSGCSAGTPTPATPTAPPTTSIVTSDPSLSYSQQLVMACAGKAVPDAAPYSGSLHPALLVVEGIPQRADESKSYFATESQRAAWLRAEWTSPLQLVVCADPQQRMLIQNCGGYANSFGQTFDVKRYRLVTPVKVVEASTGLVRSTSEVHGTDPEICQGQEASYDKVGGPPDLHAFALALTTR
jgi:hypothetical protein